MIKYTYNHLIILYKIKGRMNGHIRSPFRGELRLQFLLF